MTRDKILNMEAGRKIDEFICRDVMNWSIDPGLPDETAFYYPPEWNDKYKAWPSTKGRQQKHSMSLVPHYSTDIRAALDVVEKLETHKDEILFECVRKGSVKGDLHWFVRFRKCGGNQHDYFGEVKLFDELPKLICSLAYQAVMDVD